MLGDRDPNSKTDAAWRAGLFPDCRITTRVRRLVVDDILAITEQRRSQFPHVR